MVLVGRISLNIMKAVYMIYVYLSEQCYLEEIIDASHFNLQLYFNVLLSGTF